MHPQTQLSYLPKLLLDRIQSESPLTHFETGSSSSVLMLSDIQQFTSLVGRYTSSGRAGLEELTWLLNNYFTTLVDVVARHGGDVLYIAGDAFLCHWPSDEFTGTEAALSATSCALEIQQRLHTQLNDHEQVMATRIGIGFGNTSIGFFGGYRDRWELVVQGDALDEAVAAEIACPAGGVRVGKHLWEHVREYCTATHTDSTGAHIEEVRAHVDPMPRRATTLLPNTDLKPFLPPSAIDRMEVSEVEWLAESRRISIAMAAIPFISEIPPDDVQLALKAFQSIVDQYEGSPKVDVDGKGILLLALFGIPSKAHENDAERATVCARQIAKLLLPITRQGVGVATGRAICGTFGSDYRRDYMVRGQAINLAARLMQSAEAGQVLCDEATRESAAGRVQFISNGELNAKGFDVPVAVFQPTGRTRSQRKTWELVGRAAERKQLEQVINGDNVLARQIFLIEADAGLGKSRLTDHAANFAEQQGCMVLRAAADAIERTTPYFAWRQLFSEMLDVRADSSSDYVSASIASTLAEKAELASLIPLISDVIAIAIPDNDTTRDMTGDIRAANLARLLIALLTELTKSTTLVLIVEDAHWLDSASWGLLLEILESIPFKLSVVTTRIMDDPLSNEQRQLREMAGERHLPLSGLSKNETGMLLAGRLGVENIPQELSNFVHERVNGHPFFAEELLTALLERQIVRVEDGSCLVSTLTPEDLPATVEQVIISRLDALPQGEQMCLKVASVIGQRFPSRLVERSYPIGEERPLVEQRLHHLANVQLIDEDSPAPELEYLFRHSITRDATYKTMPGAQRRPLHRSVARCLESSNVEPSSQYTLLAHHWSEAEDGPRAAFYLENAGNQSMRTGAFREAVELLSKAIQLMDEGAIAEVTTKRALWEKDIGIASYYLGDMPASRRHLENALVHLHRPVPSSVMSALPQTVKEFLVQMLHGLLPNRYLGRKSARRDLLTAAVNCYKQLGQAYYIEGEPAPLMLYLTLSGLNLGEEAGDSAALARIMINAAVLYYVIGQGGRAEVFATRAIAMSAEPEHRNAQGYVWHMRALMLAQQGAWHDCRIASNKALKIAQNVGDYALESEVKLVRSAVARYSGDFIHAPAAWSQAREIATRIGDSRLKTLSLLDEVEHRLALGDITAAETALAAALSIPTPETDQDMYIEKSRATATTRLRRGQIEEALQSADYVYENLVKSAPVGYHSADHFAAVVEVYLEVLQLADSPTSIDRSAILRKARKGVRLLARQAKTFGNIRPRALLLKGILCRLSGKSRKAETHYLASRDLARQMGMPFDEGRALLELARLQTANADSFRSEARVIFEGIKAPYYAELADSITSP